MKTTITVLIAMSSWLSWAEAMTVKEGDIAGKTNLVLVEDTAIHGTKATILADAKGMSLYTFDADSQGVSHCSGSCLQEWPPLHVPAGTSVAAPFGTIQGNDGQTQLTLNGLPLYHYDDDKKPGDTFGVYPSWEAIIVQP